MSSLQEAFKRATLQLNGRPVIEIPAESPKTPPRFRMSWAVLVFAALAAMTAHLWAEREARVFQENGLMDRMKALEARHDKLSAMIEKDDKYLDVRVQLELMDLKSSLRALTAQMEMVDPKHVESVSALRDSTKQEIFYLNKRLHENQREHALLSDRIEALEKAQPKS